MKKLNKSASYDEASGIYTFSDPVNQNDAYFGVEFENPLDSNTNVVQTVEEALEGQTLVPVTATQDPDTPDETPAPVVMGSDSACQGWRGNYFDVYYGDIHKFGNTMSDVEKNPETATIKTTFHRPVWTKGASVSFWFKPTADEVTSRNSIFTMYKANNFSFVLQADGSLSYLDLNPTSWSKQQPALASNGRCMNQFNANGDASLVTADAWNHYTVTFANDWIQVYVNGTELIYKNVSMTRTYTKQFNAGFLTRYNSIGLTPVDPDSIHQYITKAGGVGPIQSVDNYMNSGDVNDKDDTAIRMNGVYGKSCGYLAASDAGTNGIGCYLMMTNLTMEGANFYMGGCPSVVSKALGWYNAGIGGGT